MAKLIELLWDISKVLTDIDSNEAGWIPPTCPKCNSPLSAVFAADKLVCIKCHTEYALKENLKRCSDDSAQYLTIQP